MELRTLNHCVIESITNDKDMLEFEIYDLCSGQKTYIKLSNSNIIDLKCFLDKELLKRTVPNV